MMADKNANATWHDLKDPNDPELDQLAAHYHLHPLHVEDCRHRNQRAKIEEGDGYLFAVLKILACPDGERIVAGELDVFLGDDWVITVREPDHPALEGMLAPVHQALPKLHADETFYRIVDIVVDSYLPILDRYDDLIDEIEDQVLTDTSPEALSRIFSAKQYLVELRRVLVNTRDLAGHLQRTETALIRRELWPFLRDVYDHVARNLDMVETQRDLLNGALDVYLSSVANRTNQVMKVLTVMGTATLPALILSGFYGMNVKGLPWAESPSGAAIVGGAIVVCTAVLLAFLKWLRWF